MMKQVLLFLLVFCAVNGRGQNIVTIAGNGTLVNNGDGGIATNAGIYLPTNCIIDKQGNFYISTAVGNTVRKISASGIISKIVGTGLGGFSGDNGIATSAQLNNIQFVALDSSDNMYVTDELNNRVRRIDKLTGIITTIAGNGTAGFAGDGFPSTNSILNNPNGLCFDKKGNLYIADYGNSRIRKIGISGIITTFAGTGVNGYNGDGGLADTSKLRGALELCSDDIGNIYIADEVNGRIRKVDTFGIIHTVAGNGTVGFSGDGTPATSAMIKPHFVTIDKF